MAWRAHLIGRCLDRSVFQDLDRESVILHKLSPANYGRFKIPSFVCGPLEAPTEFPGLTLHHLNCVSAFQFIPVPGFIQLQASAAARIRAGVASFPEEQPFRHLFDGKAEAAERLGKQVRVRALSQELDF
jgi:hypothetical protein